MNPTAASITAAILRWMITAAISFLLAKKVITEEMAHQINVANVALAATPLVLTLLWSIYANLKAHFKINTALALPSGSTPQDVHAVLKESSIAHVISTQPPQDAIRRLRVNPM